MGITRAALLCEIVATNTINPIPSKPQTKLKLSLRRIRTCNWRSDKKIRFTRSYLIIMNKDEIISLIKEDQWMMEILTSAKALNLPDWWICAGFVRSKIWDVLHDFSERTNNSRY